MQPHFMNKQQNMSTYMELHDYFCNTPDRELFGLFGYIFDKVLQ